MLGKNTCTVLSAPSRSENPILLRDPSAFDVTGLEEVEIHGLASMIGGSLSVKLASTPERYGELKEFIKNKAIGYLYDNAESIVQEYLRNKFPNQMNEFGESTETEWNKRK